MIDLTGVEHHPILEEIVGVMCKKTQNTDRKFFRAATAYFFGKMAANQRAVIYTKDRGNIPVNIYSMALAESGFGKGHSVGIFENEFLAGFKKRFLEDTMPVIADKNLIAIATERALRNNSDQAEEYETVKKEYNLAGAYAFTFDSGTSPAVKQMRRKLILANCGSINLQIDEIGSNLVGEEEIITLFLELYDQGLVKQKLTKSTSENTRGEEIDGKTPTNMLLFGTPSKLLDGGLVESQFYTLLETGYARRCFFALGQQDRKAFHEQTAEEIFKALIEPENQESVDKWADHFHSLADATKYGWTMTMADEVAIKLIEYKINCERAADKLALHDSIRKAELGHRYFKALKLAGAYAFVDESNEIEMSHLLQAIKLAEESGECFQQILTREKAYQKLARYMAEKDEDLTHADLKEALPFYPASAGARREMMDLATAWGYKQQIVIKKKYIDGIDFYRGESLKPTDLDQLIVSYSNHYAYNYLSEPMAWDNAQMLFQAAGENWVNHALVGGGNGNGHRAEENVVSGFNLIAIDVDGGPAPELVSDLLKEYRHMIYTTKSHDPANGENRYRLILPTNYVLHLDTDDYKEFMNGILAWLPFETDETANQRAKKWSCHAGGEFIKHDDGQLFDVVPFIPKTTKNEQYKKANAELGNLGNLERWFATRMVEGSRNNHMIKFALALVDGGLSLQEVQAHVNDFNSRIQNPLDQDEIDKTVMVTVAKRYTRVV